jgi:hypothetical protein
MCSFYNRLQWVAENGDKGRPWQNQEVSKLIDGIGPEIARQDLRRHNLPGAVRQKQGQPIRPYQFDKVRRGE